MRRLASVMQSDPEAGSALLYVNSRTAYERVTDPLKERSLNGHNQQANRHARTQQREQGRGRGREREDPQATMRQSLAKSFSRKELDHTSSSSASAQRQQLMLAVRKALAQQSQSRVVDLFKPLRDGLVAQQRKILYKNCGEGNLLDVTTGSAEGFTTSRAIRLNMGPTPMARLGGVDPRSIERIQCRAAVPEAEFVRQLRRLVPALQRAPLEAMLEPYVAQGKGERRVDLVKFDQAMEAVVTRRQAAAKGAAKKGGPRRGGGGGADGRGAGRAADKGAGAAAGAASAVFEPRDDLARSLSGMMQHRKDGLRRSMDSLGKAQAWGEEQGGAQGGGGPSTQRWATTKKAQQDLMPRQAMAYAVARTDSRGLLYEDESSLNGMY
jgi:hypothetical protein